MRFTEPLQITPDYERGGYTTCRAFSFDIGHKGSGLTITVPEGFWTDLASVPRIFWSIFPPYDPRYAAAAVLHDFLRRWGRDNDGVWERFDEGTADAIFYEALKILGLPKWKAIIMYLAVRIAGAW